MRNKLFVAALIALHLLFFILSLSIGGNRIADSWDYIYQAENIRESESFYAWNMDEPVKPDYFTKRTPAYGLFLVLLGSFIPLVLLVQNILSIVVWWCVYRFIVKSGMNQRNAAGLVLITLLLQSNTLIYANTVIAEIPFQLLVLLGTLRLLKDVDQPNPRNFLLASICFTGALLFKPVMLYFWFPFMAYAFFQAKKRRKLRLIWPVFIMPATILLWSFHNLETTGWSHYSSIRVVNLKDYNTRLMLESKYGVEKADSVISSINDISRRIPDYASRNYFIRDTCSKLIRSNLPAYAKVHTKGMLAMLVDPGRYDLVQFFGIEEKENGLMYLLARGDLTGMWEIIRGQSFVVSFFFFFNFLGSIILLVSALRGFRHVKTRTVLILLCAGIICYFWILTGPVGTARYKSGILPLLVILAGWGTISPRGILPRY